MCVSHVYTSNQLVDSLAKPIARKIFQLHRPKFVSLTKVQSYKCIIENYDRRS